MIQGRELGNNLWVYGYDNENNVLLAELGLDNKRFYKQSHLRIIDSIDFFAIILYVNNIMTIKWYYFLDILSDNNLSRISN